MPTWACKQTAERLFYATAFDSLYMEGLCYVQADSLTLAQERFESCAKLEPKSAVIAYQLANLYAIQKDTINSIKQLKKAINLNPNNYYYYSELADLYTKQANFKDAAKIYEVITKKFSDKDYPLYMLSRCYYELHNYDESIATYERLEKRIGITPEMSIEKAFVMALNGNWDKIKQEFAKLHDKFPLNDDLYFREGALWQSFKPDSLQLAIDCYEKALSINPDNVDALRYLCDSYERLGNKQKIDECLLRLFSAKNIGWEEKYNLLQASFKYYQGHANYQQIIETIFQKIILANNNEERAWLLYGEFLLQNGRLDDAIETFESCTKILPSCQTCYIQWFNSSLQKDSLQLSEQVLQQALQALPGNPYFLCAQATLAYQQGNSRWQEYALQTEQALTGMQDKAIAYTVYNAISELYGLDKQYDKCTFYLEKVLELDPNNATLNNNYAYYLALQNKDLDKAEAMSKKTIEADPLNSAFLHTYGYILFLQQKWTHAKFYMQQAIEYNKEQSYEIYYDYAKLLELLGEEAHAKEIMNIANQIKQNQQKHE